MEGVLNHVCVRSWIPSLRFHKPALRSPESPDSWRRHFPAFRPLAMHPWRAGKEHRHSRLRTARRARRSRSAASRPRRSHDGEGGHIRPASRWRPPPRQAPRPWSAACCRRHGPSAYCRRKWHRARCPLPGGVVELREIAGSGAGNTECLGRHGSSYMSISAKGEAHNAAGAFLGSVFALQ